MPRGVSTWWIIKTARFDAARFERYAFQLKLYAAVLRQSFDTVDTLRAHLAYLPEASPWREVAVDQDALDAFLRELDELVGRALDLENAPLAEVQGRSGKRCLRDGCRYAASCFPELRNSLDSDDEMR